MIILTALNNKEFYLNPDHIEKMESVPETVLTLSNGKKYIVTESIDEVIDLIVRFKKRIFKGDF
ncbi:flagellar FlbD family protein [uncultured Clostridium sp.]|jgi:flagellar protein FlbD|uniref:flagellar FlbD family protein n=1 Tax=uncultured Clostridium sp. TaxID=59620 RepID=UPI002601C536|nr:flagellar FlbD family protein [uncultured Clostridium sp.]